MFLVPGQMADKMRVVGRKGNWAVKWLSAAAKRVHVGLVAAVNQQVGGSRAVHALFEVFRMAIFGVIRHNLGFVRLQLAITGATSTLCASSW